MLKLKQEAHKLKHYLKMKINSVLECFNKVLDERGNPDKKHFVAHSTIEKKIGPIKEVTTFITLCNSTTGKNECIVKQVNTGASITEEAKEKLIEETEKKALVEFIMLWDYDTGIK